jgi:hypothetical protein
MDLNTIYSDPIFLAEKHVISTKRILSESCEGLTEDQRRVVEGIYNEFVPLIKHTIILEKTLTADQINQLFTNIEQGATDAGGNRTMLGKGIDFTKKADSVINSVGKWLQNTAPVKGFDQKFENLKASVSEKFPNVAKQLSALGDLARDNPGKTAAIIGVMTSIASFAGTPAAGAAVGYALRGAVELLKGEKLSTAIGKGLKTAAYGWLAGKAFELIGDAVSAGVKAVTSPFSPKLMQIDMTHIAEQTGMPFSYESVSAFGKPEDIKQLQGIFTKASEAFNAGNYAAAEAGFQQAAQLNDYMNSMDYFLDAGISNIMDQQQTIAQMQQGVSELMKGLASVAQGAAAGATAYDKSGKPVDDKGQPVTGEKPAAKQGQRVEPTLGTPKEALIYHLRPLTESQVYLMFSKITARNDQLLTEGLLMEKDDPAAPKQGFMQKVMGKVGEFGKNLTTKVTASKLNSAWKSAGSPTDSDELADFLTKQGVNGEVVAGVYKTMKLPAPGTAGTEREIVNIKKELTQLGPETQKQLLGIMQKKLGMA